MVLDVLSITFYSNDLDKDITLRDYFKELLKELWREQEGFSGKRPFGNSGWDADIAIALIREGLVDGDVVEYDGWDELVTVDHKQLDAVVLEAISNL